MADFTPTLIPLLNNGKFRFFVQKVLPCVYDDSLSYYELLEKITKLLNTCIENINIMGGNVDAIAEAYTLLQNYVNDYFSNLDVSQEIDSKLDEMVSNGSLAQIILPAIPAIVAVWMDENITPTTPIIDKTLEISDAAADSAIVGSNLTNIKNEISRIENQVSASVTVPLTFSNGMFEANGFEDVPGQSITRKHSQIMDAGEYTITPSDTLRFEVYTYVNDTHGTSLYTFRTTPITFVTNSRFVITIAGRNNEDLSNMLADIVKFNVNTKNETLIDYNRICYDSNSYDMPSLKNIQYIDRLNYASVHIGTSGGYSTNQNIRYKQYPFSLAVKTNISTTSSEVRLNYNSGTNLSGTQEFYLIVYTTNSAVSGVRISIPTTSFSKSVTNSLSVGWNFIRITCEGGGNYTLDNFNQIRVLFYHTENTDTEIYIGAFVEVKPAIGSVIIIEDAGYYSFFNTAYPIFKNNNMPVVWALDYGLITDSTDENRQLINLTDLQTIANDGISEFSFHSYDNTITSNATKHIALKDTLKNIRFMQSHGLQPLNIYRAAWLQNLCANPELANQCVVASATHTGKSGVADFPFVDKYDIPRYGLDSRTEADFSAILNKIERQHTNLLVYFHGIGNDDRQVTVENLNTFITMLNDKISGGNVQVTTLSGLFEYYNPKN